MEGRRAEDARLAARSAATIAKYQHLDSEEVRAHRHAHASGPASTAPRAAAQAFVGLLRQVDMLAGDGLVDENLW